MPLLTKKGLNTEDFPNTNHRHTRNAPAGVRFFDAAASESKDAYRLDRRHLYGLFYSILFNQVTERQG